MGSGVEGVNRLDRHSSLATTLSTRHCHRPYGKSPRTDGTSVATPLPLKEYPYPRHNGTRGRSPCCLGCAGCGAIRVCPWERRPRTRRAECVLSRSSARWGLEAGCSGNSSGPTSHSPTPTRSPTCRTTRARWHASARLRAGRCRFRSSASGNWLGLLFSKSFALSKRWLPTIVRVPGNFIQAAISRCGALRPRRILPLGFRRQPARPPNVQ